MPASSLPLQSPAADEPGARCTDFDYELPAELIAQQPLPQRSASRLLCLDGASGRLVDAQVLDLPALLSPADLLVLNDTRVLPARLAARKPTGGRMELLLEQQLASGRALAQLRDSRAVRPGMTLETDGGPVRIEARRGEFWEVQLPEDAVPFFERHGDVPLPPYIRRAAQPQDRTRYQSVWARVPGAVAAPTASLHFDAALLAALEARGIGHCHVTLHVGAGTFQPMRTEWLDRHVMHAECYSVDAAAVAAIARTRAAGGRVVAVGTTVARALESAARPAAAEPAQSPDPTPEANPPLAPASGQTRLFIRPGHRFRVVDALLTNFHLPRSTLLMLVAAFAGREPVLAAYRHAVQARYRFFSYGDAMLIFPSPAARGG